MSVNTKMTAIADEIRELSGTTEAMGLDAMASNVSNANTEIDNQEGLLAEIASALEGKAAGGNVEYDVCPVNISSDQNFYRLYYLTVVDGEIVATALQEQQTSYNITCLCNSFFVLCFSNNYGVTANGVEFFSNVMTGVELYRVVAENGETASLHITQTHSSG